MPNRPDVAPMPISDMRKLSNPPTALLKALERVRFQFSDPVSLYHCISLDLGDSYCGVIGDGDNGAYEWFLWRNEELQTSDAAYGMIEVALRDVLKVALE